MKIPSVLEERLDNVGRNDPDEAEDIIRGCVFEMGYCPSSVAHYLFMLQDDATGLRGRVTGMEIRPAPKTPEVQ